jgi:hypothetical protein
VKRALLSLLFALSLPLHAADLDERPLVRLKNQTGADLLNQALDGQTLWSGASVDRYKGKLYDEIRLRSLDKGYITYISGEGDRDFEPQVVADTVFKQQHRLPTVEDGAKVVVRLGSGTDAATGRPYVDTWWMLDLTLFYGTYAQRMYQVDDGNGRIISYFEKLDLGTLSASTQASYQAKIDASSASIETRWPPFDSVQEISEIYGMFVVEPGSVRTSRVSFVARITFAEGAGVLARLGSEMPPVLKAGLQSGFISCVQIARQEQIKLDRTRNTVTAG